MFEYSRSFKQLIREFTKMPGIGKRSAERLAFHVLNLSEEEAGHLACLIKGVKAKVKRCVICFSLTEERVCKICQDKARNQNVICVVEHSKDIMAIEKTTVFRGVYHVLEGRISPLDKVGPEDLKVRELVLRAKKLSSSGEIVIATASDAEGEATAFYLLKLLKEYKVKLSRIAYGIPAGSALEYADSLTLSRALEGRQNF